MFLAGIQYNFLDTGLRRYDEREFGHLFCGVVLSSQAGEVDPW
jgi:hypothetical protein